MMPPRRVGAEPHGGRPGAARSRGAAVMAPRYMCETVAECSDQDGVQDRRAWFVDLHSGQRFVLRDITWTPTVNQRYDLSADEVARLREAERR